MKRSIYYVIGDVHGEAERLEQLHSDILRHHKKYSNTPNATLIHLGDYVDRGPDSYGVIEYLICLETNLPEYLSMINLKGNHEVMMMSAHAKPESLKYQHWIENGGREALESYKRRGFNSVTESHLDWISSLPTIYHDKENRLIFVHAGLNNITFPHDGDEYYLWTRSPEFFDSDSWNNPALEGVTVIHGHTPTDTFEPEFSKNTQRLNIDTGACYGGPLTAAIIENGMVVSFLKR